MDEKKERINFHVRDVKQYTVFNRSNMTKYAVLGAMTGAGITILYPEENKNESVTDRPFFPDLSPLKYSGYGFVFGMVVSIFITDKDVYVNEDHTK